MTRSIQFVRICLACLLCLTPAVAGAGTDLEIDLGRGPVTVHVPPGYQPGTPTGVVMMLHGYTSTGPETEAILQLLPRAQQLGFIYLYPTGSVDFGGETFWNATDGCCNFFGSSVDDSGYLRDLLDEVAAQLTVDPEKVFVVGHSNGGFMSHRMACDHAGFVKAIVSLAGATYVDPADCQPADTVRMLQIHGTADETIAYGGGQLPLQAAFPGAVETAEIWALKNGCDATPATSFPNIDLEADLPGAETSISRYGGCDAGGGAELWTVDEGGHVPVPSDDFHTLVLDYLFGDEGPTVFGDGFESGDLTGWGAVVD